MRSALFTAVPLALVLFGCQAEQKPLPPPPPAPEIVSFHASAATVSAGSSVTLTWETKNATHVELRDAEAGVVSGVDASASSGEVSVVVSTDRLFVLVASNARGVRESAAAVVQVKEGPHDVLFFASPSVIHAGEKAVLSWSAAGAESVSIATDGGEALDLGGQTTFGSVQIAPQAATTYVLTVDGTAYEAAIAVDPTIDAVAVTPNPAKAGEPVTISWKTSGATKLQVVGAGRGVLYEETDPAKVADGSFAETVEHNVDSGSVLSYELRAIAADGSTSSQPVSVYVGNAPVITEWNVPPLGPEGLTFHASWKTTGAETVEIYADGLRVFVSPDSAVAANGSVDLPTPGQATNYELHAIDARGAVTVSEAKTIEPVGIPSVTTFTATPSGGIANGGDVVTLTWDVPNARHLKITAVGDYTVTELNGSAAVSGTIDVYPNKDTEYLLEADNTIGNTAEASQNITVATPAKFKFSPQRAPVDALVTLTSSTLMNGGDISQLAAPIYNAPGDSFVDISATGVDINYSGPDTTAKLVTLPATFNGTLYGEPISADKVSISINGWFVFRNSSLSGPDQPTPFPNSSLDPLSVAPFWDDLYDTSAGEIFYQLDVVGSEQRLIIQWDQVEHDTYPGSVLTFQAQIYSGGKVVFAYQTLQGITGAAPSIGVVNGNESDAVYTTRVPQPGETYTFFGGGTPPLTVISVDHPISGRQQIDPTHFIQIEQGSAAIPPGQFRITEVMNNPGPGITDGQWIEVENTTSTPIDLDGWTLDFGTGTHTISGSAVIPANGFLLLGQSATGGDGLPIGYVYGNSLQIPATAPSVSLMSAGVPYSTLTLPAGTPLPGHSLQVGSVRSGMEVKTGLTELVCAAASGSSFGTNGQKGTPGAANTECPNYVSSGLITGAFESIAATGTQVVYSGTNSESVDAITPPVPVRFGNKEYATIYVNTNGFITLEPYACSSSTNCWYTNKSSINTTSNLPVGAIAPFWDNLLANSGIAQSGIYWQRMEPGLQPNDGYTIVSWEHWKDSATTSDLNFQVKFFDTGDIEFHYGSMTSTTTSYAKGTSATTWLEVPEGGAAFKININSSTAPGIAPNTGYRFAAQ